MNNKDLDMNQGNKIFVDDVYGCVDSIIRTSQLQSPRAVVITPTTGSPFLAKAIASVMNQDFEDVVHIVVADGAGFRKDVHDITSLFTAQGKLEVINLPFNTGNNGLNGHRVYAAIPLLVNADFIFFLDEDNWLADNHVSSLVETINTYGLDWAHSMRKIYKHDALYTADDNCESIGAYPPFSGIQKNWPSFIDTNCYAFRRNTIVQTAHYWYHPLRADRYFFHHVAEMFPNYRSSKQYTANYRLKQNGPVPPDYILEGNEYMLNKYKSLPWA